MHPRWLFTRFFLAAVELTHKSDSGSDSPRRKLHKNAHSLSAKVGLKSYQGKSSVIPACLKRESILGEAILSHCEGFSPWQSNN